MDTIIVNGGEPLSGCPENWEVAKAWQDSANKDSHGSFERPEWSFDCGFKLDFDGPLMRISSRFYPPKTHYGATWDGAVTVCIFDKMVCKKSFDCESLEALKTEVEKYVGELRVKLLGFFDKTE